MQIQKYNGSVIRRHRMPWHVRVTPKVCISSAPMTFKDNLCPRWTHSQRRAILTPSFLPTERSMRVVTHSNQLNALMINPLVTLRIAPPKYTWQVSSSHTNFSSGCLRYFAGRDLPYTYVFPRAHHQTIQKEKLPPLGLIGSRRRDRSRQLPESRHQVPYEEYPRVKQVRLC